MKFYRVTFWDDHSWSYNDIVVLAKSKKQAIKFVHKREVVFKVHREDTTAKRVKEKQCRVLYD